MRVFRQKQNGKAYRKWTVEIVDHLGTRRKMQAFPDKGASASLGHKLEKLVSYRTARRALDSELTEWLESLPPRMMKRLASIGLIGDRAKATATLPDFAQPMEAIKTGTADVDDTMPGIDAEKGARKQGEKQGDDFQKSAVSGQSDTVGNGAIPETKNAAKPYAFQGLAALGAGTRSGTRTPDTRIKNPML